MDTGQTESVCERRTRLDASAQYDAKFLRVLAPLGEQLIAVLPITLAPRYFRQLSLSRPLRGGCRFTAAGCTNYLDFDRGDSFLLSEANVLCRLLR